MFLKWGWAHCRFSELPYILCDTETVPCSFSPATWLRALSRVVPASTDQTVSYIVSLAMGSVA